MNFCGSLRRTMRFPGQATHVLALAIVLALPGLALQDQQSSPRPAGTAPADQDAAAKAAERRKHFEEEKLRLEESDGAKPKGIGPEAPSDPDQTLFISPAVVNMLVGESHSFSAFELEGKTVTPSAEWTLDNSDVVELSNNGGPTVISKAPGKATLRARIGSRTAEALITVHDVQKLPDGTILWSSPGIPGFKTKQIVQAVPSATGPDMYTIEQNEKGEQLIRAMFGDGRQLWMRKMSRTGPIVNAVPH
ncbi:MAG: hypothetical protein WCE53_08825 [Candidatus Acidiferrum sp.]